jgi:type IV pilus assembly protein PilW
MKMASDKRTVIRAARRAQQGFTLVELMIAVTLGLIILAALTLFFVQTSQNRSEIERNSRQIENGRFAVDALRTDVSMAGFFADIWQPLAVTTWLAPEACVTDPAAMGFVSGLLTPRLPVPLFGYANAAGVPGCVTGAIATTDVLVVRRFNSESTAVASAAPSQVYVQITECKADEASYPDKPFVIAPGSTPGAFVLHKLDCVTPAAIWRYREQLYYVRNCSECAGAGDGIPTLWRLELDGGAVTAVPLVEGIEQFRVDYGLDADGDGTPEAWRRCDTTTPCTALEWSNMISARIYVLSKNLERSANHTDDRTYSMGLSGTVGPFNDAFKRAVYTAQVTLQNRAGPREPKL